MSIPSDSPTSIEATAACALYELSYEFQVFLSTYLFRLPHLKAIVLCFILYKLK